MERDIIRPEEASDTQFRLTTVNDVGVTVTANEDVQVSHARIQSADGKTLREVLLPRGVVQACSAKLMFMNADDLTQLLDALPDCALSLLDRSP